MNRIAHAAIRLPAPYDPAAVSRLLEQGRVDTVVAHALPREQLTDWRDRYPATTLVNLQPLSALNIEAEVKEGLQGCVSFLTELRYRLRRSIG